MIFCKFVQIMPLGPKVPPPPRHMVNIGLYRENMKKSSFLKPQGLYRALIFGILHHLVDHLVDHKTNISITLYTHLKWTILYNVTVRTTHILIFYFSSNDMINR